MMLSSLTRSSAWAAARPRPDQNADVVEHDAPGRLANKTRKLGERRSGRRSVQLFAIPSGRCNGRTVATSRVGRTEVGYIPLDRTQRVLMIHVYVVETFHLAALRVLNHCPVRTPEIAEAPPAGSAAHPWLAFRGSALALAAPAAYRSTCRRVCRRRRPTSEPFSGPWRGTLRCICASPAYSSRNTTRRFEGRSAPSEAV